MANYSYLADGTRTSAVGSDGSGLVRRGSLTYRKAADGSLEFEGADFDGGRFTAGQVIYHITDHLGSVIGIVRSGSTTPYEYDMYDAYGKRTRTQLSAPFTPEASLRFGFTGKEDQSVEFSVPYTDFGARHYSPALTRWLTPDPLSEKYYGISPYAYCNGDPVNLVDLDGESWGDKVVGMLVGTLTNLIPFSSFLRDFYSPDNSTDYNNALKSTDKAAMITGEVLTTGGTAAMAAGTIATEAGGALALSGVGAPAGAVATTAGATATIAGATATAEGAILMANSASNSSQGYKRGKSGESSTSSGGTKTPSKTLWQSKDGNEPRIDFENSSNTGNRGRIHLHIDGKKYYYDDKGYSFYTETKTGERVYKSKSFNKHWLNKKEVHDAIEKGKRYLGK